jgi:predicted RNA binding protein YcfA (HicA-like mRNA interferase family)
MGVNHAHLRSLTAREVISALIRDGFSFDRGAGSHQVYYHPDGRRGTVTFHAPSDTFAPKTLKSMVEREAHWSEDDLRRLKLIR